MSKPSLQEIADMPLSQTVKAMREHYVPDWGKPIPDGATSKSKFAVQLTYSVSYRQTEKVEVEAWTAEEAEELAADQIEKSIDKPWDADFEVDDALATKKATQQ